MSAKRNFSDIIQSIVNRIPYEVEILSVDVSGDNQVLNCDDVLYAQAGFKVTIQGVEYTILEVDADNNTITVESSVIIAGSFDLYQVYFFHGTPIETGVELNLEPNSSVKTPMIWLMEGYEEDFDYDYNSIIERRTPARIFALSQEDFENFTTDLVKERGLKPMARLMDLFVQEVRSDIARFNTHEWGVKHKIYSKFGVYITEKGVPQSKWADKLSGVESNEEFVIYKLDPCLVGNEGINFMEIGNDFIVQ